MAALHHDFLRWVGSLSSPRVHRVPCISAIKGKTLCELEDMANDHKWIAFGVCGWCATSLLQNVIYNLAGELVCRIFLGAFEGLFGTGIVYYLSLWYHRTEMGVRVFWFLGPTAIAG